jgi:hypothetical protein
MAATGSLLAGIVAIAARVGESGAVSERQRANHEHSWVSAAERRSVIGVPEVRQ